MRAAAASTARHLSRCRVPARGPSPSDARRVSGGECPPAEPRRTAPRGAPRDASTGRGRRLRRRRVFVFPLVVFRRRRRRRRSPRLTLPRPDQAPVPGAPRPHGDERCLARHRWDDPDFVDPGLYDTRLTALGMEQAASLRPVVAALDPKPELIVSSPLSRALLTADLAFADLVADDASDAPRESACALARERVFHASDVGRTPDEIARDFPGWCLRETREVHGDVWWYTGAGTGTGRGRGRGRGRRRRSVVVVVVVDSFASGYPGGRGDARTRARVRGADGETGGVDRREGGVHHRARRALGVWFSLTGREFENCELVEVDLADLRPGVGEMPV